MGLNNGFEQEYFGIYVHINIFQIVRFLCSIVFMFVFLRDLQRNFFNKGFSQWVSAMVSTRVSAMVSTRVSAMVSTRVSAMVSTRVSAMVSTRGISNIIRTNIPDTFFTYIDIQKWVGHCVIGLREKKTNSLFHHYYFANCQNFLFNGFYLCFLKGPGEKLF